MGNDPVLRMQEVSYAYGEGRPAIDHVTVDIRRGERIAVLGANGAGKSTFFLCMNGVLRPQQGAVFLHGQEVGRKGLRKLREAVGVVFQDADSQIVAPTVWKEISFGPMNLGLSAEEVGKRTMGAVEDMGLRGMEDRPPHGLSGGEKKRVTIGSILAMEPELIVFDEPTASLDSQNGQALEEVLEELARDGRAVVLSTHDVDFAYRFADRVLVFSQGSIIADGDAADIFSDGGAMRKAGVGQPSLLQFYGLLVEKGVLGDWGRCPKSFQELSQWLEMDIWREGGGRNVWR